MIRARRRERPSPQAPASHRGGRAADPRGRERDRRRRRRFSTRSGSALGGGEERVLVVVPALNSPLKHWASDEDGARAAAQAAARASLAAMRAAGSRPRRGRRRRSAAGDRGRAPHVRAGRADHLDPSGGPLALARARRRRRGARERFALPSPTSSSTSRPPSPTTGSLAGASGRLTLALRVDRRALVRRTRRRHGRPGRRRCSAASRVRFVPGVGSRRRRSGRGRRPGSSTREPLLLVGREGVVEVRARSCPACRRRRACGSEPHFSLNSFLPVAGSPRRRTRRPRRSPRQRRVATRRSETAARR